jgi:hypothetical protein
LPVTYHVVIAFDRDAEGDLKPGEAREVLSPIVAERRARALSVEHAGAVAFSRTGDPSTREFQDAVILARFGEVAASFQLVSRTFRHVTPPYCTGGAIQARGHQSIFGIEAA